MSGDDPRPPALAGAGSVPPPALAGAGSVPPPAPAGAGTVPPPAPGRAGTRPPPDAPAPAPGDTAAPSDADTASPSGAEALALLAALLAVDPAGLGGVRLAGPPGPLRDAWLALLARLLPAGTPWRRLPAQAGEDRLLGGLDLAATLATGRPVLHAGLLAESDGGVVVAAMAERLAPAVAARLASVLDNGEVLVEREGLSERQPARLALVALDEAEADDAALAPALADRLALVLPLAGLPWRLAEAVAAVPGLDAAVVAAARERLPQVGVDDDTMQSLVATALALGVDSARAPWLALRLAKASAALFGRDTVGADDATLAARWVLAPRATRLPAPPDDPAEPPPPEPPPPEPPPEDPPPDADAAEPPPATDETQPLDERLVDAAVAAIPAGLLAQLRLGLAPRSRAAGGRAGAATASRSRGRPLGARRGRPVAGARLHLVATLRAAVPWQPLRRQELARSQARQAAAGAAGAVAPLRQPLIHVRADDFHVRRLAERRATATLFVVDASGSQALHRLAEAKGAVELLLAECYVRRDEVAVIGFRGRGAELLLPPTRSLVRARRALAGLPGGGGTPLAAGLEAATRLALQVRAAGASPLVVLLTDGRANVALDGAGGRERAAADALAAAQRLRGLDAACLVVDTSVRPEPAARALAEAAGARYLALPQADARVLAAAVAAGAAGGPSR